MVDCRLRVNVVGECRCGKTSVIRCLAADDSADISTPPATHAVDSFLWQPFTTHRQLESGTHRLTCLIHNSNHTYRLKSRRGCFARLPVITRLKDLV